MATLAHTVFSVLKVWLLIRHSEHHLQADGITLCVTGNADVSPFSFCSYVVLSRRDYESCDAAILAHERGHIRQHHTLDVLLVSMLTALQWFNPAMWMLRQDLRDIHEYEADAAALSQGIDMRQYQYLLIQKAVGACGYSVASGITHSTLKNRINMMLNHRKPTCKSWLKLLALLPIVGIALALNARTVSDYVYENVRQLPQKKVVKKGRRAAVIKTSSGIIEVKADSAVANKGALVITTKKQPAEPGKDAAELADAPIDKVFDVVEQMPEYPGGMAEMMKFLRENVCYPKAALAAGLQGRVVVSFIVEADGTLSSPVIRRSVSEELDAEALRLIQAMPKWKPGMQNGEAVRVHYTIPVVFMLQ